MAMEDKEREITDIWNGEDAKMGTLVKTMAHAHGRVEIVQKDGRYFLRWKQAAASPPPPAAP